MTAAPEQYSPPPHLPKTLQTLRESGWKSRPVKDEVRFNFLRLLQDRA